MNILTIEYIRSPKFAEDIGCKFPITTECKCNSIKLVRVDDLIKYVQDKLDNNFKNKDLTARGYALALHELKVELKKE